MTLLQRDRSSILSRIPRREVVEPVDSPQSTSDGRAIRSGGDVLPRRSLGSQIRSFAAIGIVSTLAWAGLYSLLRGAGLGSVAANGIALVVTAVGNTAANRRVTFGVTGRSGRVRDHGAGLAAFVLAISLTSASATALDHLAPHSGRLLELAVLASANVAATAGRFALLRAWVRRASPVRAT